MSKQNLINDYERLSSLGYSQTLKRELSFIQLVSFGLNYLQPIGPAVIFGFLFIISGGTVTLPYIIAFVGISFTLFSYAFFLKRYPLAGSVYSYVTQSLGKKIGFIAGWLLLLDYIFIPAITIVSASNYIHASIPIANYYVLLFLLTGVMAYINIRGIKLTANISLIVLLMETLIVIGFLILCYLWLYKHHVHLLSTIPFHFNHTGALLGASSLAIFGYLGFDAIATLSEETRSPEKIIPKAMLTCLIIGCGLAALTGYLGVLVISHTHHSLHSMSWANSALFHVSKKVGGQLFASLYLGAFVLAMIATNVVGTASGARLLYAMGRDNMLPQSIFSRIHPKWKTPHLNIILISILCIILGISESAGQIAEIINYGAITSFILLNVACFRCIIVPRPLTKQTLLQSTIPLLGFLILLTIFTHMKSITLVCGTIWLIVGAILLVINTYKRTSKIPT